MTKTGSSLDCFEFSTLWFFEFVSEFELRVSNLGPALANAKIDSNAGYSNIPTVS